MSRPVVSSPARRSYLNVPASPTSCSLRLALVALFLLLATSATHASVTLVSFTATAGDGQVLLRWETATEINSAGFFIQRSLQATDGFGRISPFIPARGDSLIGAVYPYVDEDVESGMTYYYLLEAIDNDQSTELHGPVSATVGPVATETPTATSTPVPTATPTRTATARPTQTATPTSTRAPSVTLTATSGPATTSTPTKTPTTTQTPTTTRTPSVTPTPTRTATPGPGATATRLPTSTLQPTRTRRPTVTMSTTPLTTLAVGQVAVSEGTATSTAIISPSTTPTASPTLVTVREALVTLTAQTTDSPLLSEPTGTLASAGLESQGITTQSSTPTPAASALEQAPPRVAGANRTEPATPDSSSGGMSRLVGGLLAVFALLIAGLLYATARKKVDSE